MLSHIALQFGTGSTKLPLAFAPESMTIFVGPNGSGKSLVLRELQEYAEQGPTSGRKILATMSLRPLGEDAVRQMLRSRQGRVPVGETMPEGSVRLLKHIPATGGLHPRVIDEGVLLKHLTRLYDEQQLPPTTVFHHFISLFTLALDGRTRFALVEERPGGDLLAEPLNHLAALFDDGKARLRVREILADAFGLYFVIDPTNLGALRIRMAMRPPADELEEQALDQRARAYHSAAIDIAELSDGVKAFTGIIGALMSSDYRLILVDEPDAFLHPPLARKLGYRMTTIAAERGANIFAASHSADFLMGCVEAGKPLDIVRLTYESGVSTARMLQASELTLLMRDPLLRSTNVLSALFHRGAIVCESDVDRSFYQEVNARLLVDSAGIRDSVFLNAQNKQTVRRLVEPLRRMGIPAVAVVDIDILKGGDLKDLLVACNVPSELAHSLTVLRSNVARQFEVSGANMKAGGLALLGSEAAESGRSLLGQLAEYGIFVVPTGEVESWLGYLRVQASKSNWLPEIFEAMGTDPDDSRYIRPSEGDVWQFVREIAKWVHDPSRKGMPLL